MTTIQRTNNGPQVALDSTGAARLIRTFRWPLAALLLTGMIHFTLEAIWPDLRSLFVPASLAPLLLAFGIWTGYRIAGAGSVLAAIVAGAILGLLPLVLDVVGFGVILDRGVQNGVLAGIFGFATILFGTLIGAGFARSGEPNR